MPTQPTSQPARHRPARAVTGPHELGQNDLADRRVADRIASLLPDGAGPVVELGPGDGALTRALARLGRPVIAVELDPRRARRLRARSLPGVTVVEADALRFTMPAGPHAVAGNIPFHLTTPVLRRLLGGPGWTDAVLLVQWEVCRKRAGVGGTTLMTAAWWPWFEFVMHGRVPASAFRPLPSVDGGILGIRRRQAPLVADRAGYQRLVRDVFTGRGRGLGEILPAGGHLTGRATVRWLRGHGLSRSTLPRELRLAHWVSLWDAARG